MTTSPAILRGPMVTRATQQFLRQVDWSGLDYLDSRSSAGNRRHPVDRRSNCCAIWRCDRNDSAGGRTDRRTQSQFDVCKGERPGLGNHRKHELFPLSKRRETLRNIWFRRRRTRGKRVKSTVFWALFLSISRHAKQATAECQSSVRSRSTLFLKYSKKLPINYARESK